MFSQIAELKNIAKSIFSGVPLNNVDPSEFEVVSGVPLINIKDIVHDQIDWKNLFIISVDGIRKPERFYVQPGDVLITCRGTQFKSAVVPETLSCALITANLIAIRPNPEIVSSIYLSAYLRSKGGERELLSRRTSQTAQIVLNFSNVEKLRIPLPPLSVQEKIARVIEALDEEYQLNQEAVELNRKIRNQIVTDMIDKINKENRDV